MRKVKLSEEIAVQRALRKLSRTNRVEGQPEGVIDFNYVQFMEATDGAISSQSEVSILLNALVDQGKIEKVRRGTSAYPSRWSVGSYIENEISVPTEIIVEKTEEVIPAPKATKVEDTHFTPQLAPETQPEEAKADEQTVTIGEVRETVRGMAEYLAETQREMMSALGDMVAKLTIVDPDRIETVEASLLDATIELDQLKSENRRLLVEVESARNEVANKEPELNINKHVIYRNRNQILDEMERWINTPGWQKQGKSDYFKKSICAKLAEIMREVGVEEGV